ncbi:aldehyde dehydrogenase family protein [Candidatus Woesearchaeota archaeon]|nr:aldehyde dehydrogenase family protein [Candidatus Woesearchaeota archaeon]
MKFIKDSSSIPVIDAREYIVGGKKVTWDGPMQEIFSPLRLEKDDGSLEIIKIGQFPLIDEDAARAILKSTVDAYERGKGEWPCMSVKERIPYFERFIMRLREQREHIIQALVWDIAKSTKDATSEFDRTIQYIEESIEELRKLEKSTEDVMHVGNVIAKVKRSPYGIVFCMGPYNYPMNETFATIIPAILMGNVVIVKPPKRGSMVYKYIVDALDGTFPPGVFSVLFGRGRTIVEPIMKSGEVSIFGFIGAHNTANHINAMHPKPNRLKRVYGLDAKNMAIILNDADIDETVQECLAGTLSYNGQRCTALKLLYLHKEKQEEFLRAFCQAVDCLPAGIPQEDPKITPLPDERLAFYQGLLQDALEKGAKVINEPALDVETYFYPKVLFPVTKDMRIFKEEQFGPLVPIVPFEDIEEPISVILDTEYGQQCSIFGKDPDTIAELVDFLVNLVGRVNLNTQCQRGPDILPFTGRKDSAVGTLSVKDALLTFSLQTVVSTKADEQNKDLFRELGDGRRSKYLRKDILF